MGGVALGVHEGDCNPVYLRQMEPLLLRITTPWTGMRYIGLLLFSESLEHLLVLGPTG